MSVLIYRLLLLLSTQSPQKTHFKIARTMLDYYDKIGGSSIDEMARLCNVSKSTLSKFATAIGFDNYIDLKDSSGFIENRYENNLNYLSNIIKPLNSTGPSEYIYAIEKDIHSFHEELDYNKIDQLVNDLINYKKVSAFGFLLSGYAAFDLQAKLAYKKKFIYTTMSDLEQETAITRADSDSLIIIFSNSGKYITEEYFLKERVRKKLFDKSSAKIVLITSNQDMKNHKNVDLCISYKNTSHFQTHSIMFQLIIDLIVYRYHLFKELKNQNLTGIPNISQ